jgi:arylsulfatase A-like enzyme
MTGQYSARSGINSFLEGTASNLARDNANNLSLNAPSMVRAFHDAGYATGHFGKWHMGGGRDVGYAVGTTAGRMPLRRDLSNMDTTRRGRKWKGLATESST